MIQTNLTINCKGFLINLSEPRVMGILNLTPDSFYAGSRVQETTALLHRAETMLTEGATFLDIGAMSTRPNAEILPLDVELNRLLPALKALLKHFPQAIVSVDTIYSHTARVAVEEGAALVNDISGGTLDANMFATVAALGVPYVLMHTRGTPKTMQQLTDYQDVALEVLDDLIQKVGQLRGLGVKDILLDVGFGFGKNLTQNFILLKKLAIFKILDIPLLAGLSRKSMIWRTLGISPEQAMNGTTALNMVALMHGAKVLRVHDVRPAVETIQLFQHLGM